MTTNLESPTPNRSSATATERYFLGATTRARIGWERFFAEPEPPKRYGAQAAQKYIDERLQDQQESAHRFPFSGYISSVVVLQGSSYDELTAVAVHAAAVTDEEAEADTCWGPSVALMRWLATHDNTFMQHRSTVDIGVRWFGFDIRELLPMAATEVMRYNSTVDQEARVRIPYGVWTHPMFDQASWADPYELMVPNSMRKSIDLYGLCEFMGLEVPATLGDSAEEKAKLAQRLVERAQLYPNLRLTW